MPDRKGSRVKEKIEKGVPYNRLKGMIKGESLQPGDVGYENARKLWNGMIDKRPAFIARVLDEEDISTVVNFAREYNVIVAVRCGGHNVTGNASCDGGIVIDLQQLKGNEVFPQTQTCHAQSGLTWGEFDKETYAHGLATTGGLISSTGISGFTLGGGIGWLMRKYGLTMDNLLSAELINADGNLIHASPNENSDLFWGLCGAGANFGIVTKFEFQLHSIGEVLAGMAMYPLSGAKKLMQFFRDYIKDAPDELMMMPTFAVAPPAPFVPIAMQGTPVIVMLGCYCGDIARGEEILAPLRKFGQPAIDHFGPMPYTSFQQMLDALAPKGMQNYWKSAYTDELSDNVIDILADSLGNMPSPLSAIHVVQMGGAVSRVPEDATAFSHRNAKYLINIPAMWHDPVDGEKNISWIRKLESDLKPHTINSTYINFLGNEGEDKIRSVYGEEKFARLVQLKKRYDPDNFFRLNQNIRPDFQI